jgi:SEC-C motif-containing protein
LPFLRREAQPPTPEALMRSRFTAFARKDADHLWRTWHPRTRPDAVEIDPNIRWDGLTVVTTTKGGEEDDTGTVTFKARYTSTGGPGLFREHSRFARRAGRWLYVDGDQNS